jgi:hypothetical protein
MPNVLILNEDEKSKELKRVLGQITSITIPEGFHLSLDQGNNQLLFDSHIPALVELFQSLAKCEFYFLPEAEVGMLTSLAQKVQELYTRSQAQSVPKQERDYLIQESEALYGKSFTPVATVLAYWTAKETDVAGRQRQADQAIEQISEKNREAERILKQLQETTQKATIEQEAIHFSEEAQGHKKSSYAWLAVSAAIAVLTLWFAWDNYSYFRQLLTPTEPQIVATLTTAQSIQLGLSKLFLFSFLVGGIVWSGRVYRAHRHNYVVNKHRQNALNTFKTFVGSTEDQQTKNAVLLQATQCIFMPQSTGYITQEGDSTGHPQILEITRGMMDSGKS